MAGARRGVSAAPWGGPTGGLARRLRRSHGGQIRDCVLGIYKSVKRCLYLVFIYPFVFALYVLPERFVRKLTDENVLLKQEASDSSEELEALRSQVHELKLENERLKTEKDRFKMAPSSRWSQGFTLNQKAWAVASRTTSWSPPMGMKTSPR